MRNTNARLGFARLFRKNGSSVDETMHSVIITFVHTAHRCESFISSVIWILYKMACYRNSKHSSMRQRICKKNLFYWICTFVNKNPANKNKTYPGVFVHSHYFVYSQYMFYLFSQSCWILIEIASKSDSIISGTSVCSNVVDVMIN